jgi:predicted permease
MAMRDQRTAVHARLLAFVDTLVDEVSLPIHLKREARADFMAHLEADVAVAISRGESEDQAVESAIRSFGAMSDVRQALRNAAAASARNGRHWLAVTVDSLVSDVRYAARHLWSRRATSTMAIATLALGIGITSAAYAVFDWVLVRPLPYPAAHELARVFAAGTTPLTPPSDLTFGEVEAIARSNALRTYLASSSATRVMAAASVDPTHVTVARIAGDLFATLGVDPHLGRALTADEIAAGATTVVLSERFWRTRFAASNVADQVVTIDGVAYTIAGVMPAGRGYPRDADIWRPLALAERNDDDQEMATIVRVKPGVGLTAASAEVEALAVGETRGARTAWLEDMQRTDVRAVRGALSMVMALSGMLLLIACTNVAALIGGCTMDRMGELAVRGAIGASRPRLLQQIVIELLVLTLVGGAAGLIIGGWSVDLLRTLAPRAIPRMDEVSIDARVILAGILATASIGLSIGVAVAMRTTRRPLMATIHLAGSPRATPFRFAARALTAVQAALAVVLIAASFVLGRALQELVSVDHGFDPADLFAVHLYMRGPESPDARTLFPELVDAARGLQGVAAAAVALRLPTQIGSIRSTVTLPGQNTARVIVRPITNDYFAVTKIALREGRTFTTADRRGSDRVLIVNESFARDVLQGTPAIGVRLTSDLVDEPMTIVGVVADVTPAGESDRPAMYVALDQLSVAGGALLVRTTLSPAAVLTDLRSRLRAVAPGLPLDRITVMTDSLAEGRATTRFLTELAAAFGLVALVLATFGVYGQTRREVGARRRELAVRQALGASPRAVLWHAIRPGTVALVAGSVVGAIASVGVMRWVSSLIVGVVPLDAKVLALAPVLLAIVGGLFARIATRRLLAVDPGATLRQ